ncbi:hypothetical protein N431DRAFT_462884 [Stipitochalara longipes BDJ]|nr:hypothetical protein N431DRAFT_462884 [Stipitochalara longipes BDJ]
MAISDAVQTLSAAFSFGILLQAASGTLFLYYRGHGPTIFQDGRRLVLVLFLLFAALWAQIDFVNLLLPVTSTTACQVTLVFSTIFDQLARVVMEQFLLWSVGHGTKMTAERLVLQVVLLFRLIAGGLLVGFTRPDFAPACVARTSVLPVAIVVLVLDVIIIGVLVIRALSLGMFGDLREKDSSPRQEQSRALIISIAGFTVWTGTSVAMILGIPTILLIVRTVLPSNGLLILVGIITMFLGPLMLAREEEAITPEARSPFVTPMPPSRELFRDNVASNGSPISGHGYTKSGGLFVVNPSSTPRDSPTAMFQGNSRGDTKGFTKLGEEITVQSISRDVPGRPERPDGKYGAGYRGSSGVFPSTFTASPIGVTGALAPQIRPNITMKTQDLSAAIQQKRSLFNWSKPPPKVSVRSLAISQPVMANEDGSAIQPVARMQTIDLATAAINERKRREEAAARSKLVANKPPPQPPGMSAQEALRRSVSVKRKEMPSYHPDIMPTIPASSASGLSVDAANGSTTSTSLSPGREEVRRRSPRNANSFDISMDEKPSRKLPLQRKGTIGLPSNPKSQRITMAREMGMPRQQTVMLMNEIVYDDPGMVRTIINGAPEMYASAKKNHKMSEKTSIDSTASGLHSANSIIHRPRPYKRKTEDHRNLFPSEPSPGHRRSRSGSSIVVRKSFLMSNPGSPTLLPPLPPPPTSATKLPRLLPNDTKSMTFDEKIQLLFPAPPGGPVSKHNRRSSVPSLPRVPSVFMSESPQAQSPTGDELPSQRASKRTTIASFGIPDVLNLAGSPKLELSRQEERQTYRFSANTYRTIADQVGETWIPGIPPKEIDVRNAIQQPAPRPSAYDMRQSHFTEATSSDESSQADSTTYWGSIHSEIPPIDLSKSMQTAQPTMIQRSGPRSDASQGKTFPPVPQIPQVKREKEDAVMTVMLDTEETARSVLSGSGPNRGSFFLDADQALPGDKTPTAQILPSWHRRIGDDLPTFSERKSSSRSRKMPPPTPLLLNKTGRKAKVIIRATEPSPPADSPERAIQEIQAQLKRFEEPSRGSVGSLLRHLPNAATDVDEQDQNSRLRLLENLEKEMGQQQDQWQLMQTNLDRDSMSVVMTPQADPSEEAISRHSSQRSARTPPGIMSRRARIRSSMTVRSKGEDSSRTNSTASSDNSRASVWQQRLAEAQMAYVENAPDLLRKRSLNFLSVSKAQQQQLGSPTPPDSDTDMEFESESENGDVANHVSQAPASLWQPPVLSPEAAAGSMWSLPSESTISGPASPEPPARDVRPAQRRLDYPLVISSFDLWTKPRSSNHSRPVVALWGSKPVRPRSIVTRRAIHRPQRKSRRVTFLPDIVESPVPIPNKRDTLGIFQFPWGETSDQPVYQPAFNPALLAGPTINARLDARSRQLEPESEYASSFFDDYDDGEMDPESDDDFDETTLWEIANLLNTKDVPSKNSLLPSGRAEIIEDYDESESDSEDNASSKTNFEAPPLRLPIQPLSVSRETSQLWASDVTSAFSAVVAGLPEPEPNVWKALVPSANDAVRSKPRTPDALPILATRDLWTVPEVEVNSLSSSPSMWTTTESYEQSSSEAPTPGTNSLASMWSPPAEAIEDRSPGLFTPPSEGSVTRTTQEVPAAIKMVKAPRQAINAVPRITSQNMWTQVQNSEGATEWISKSTAPTTRRAASSFPALWVPSSKEATITSSDLFDLSTSRSVFRTTSLAPAAINMICKPRKSRGPLSQLTSSGLWNGCDKLPIEQDWISVSSVRPESPSVYSATSSGNSSPSSDSSSVKSTSTKASSLWGSIGAASVSTWWEGKKSAPTSSEGESKQASKIPIHKPSFKQLAPLRESRVLASRDLWESRAPVLDVPAKKFRKGTVTAAKHIRQHSSVAASPADWKAALAQAILAGAPKKSLTRPLASISDWESALAEAVALGQLSKPSKYDPSVIHPVFFTESLVSSSLEVHPAAIGYAAKRPAYDASVLHPVFFTECLTSNAREVHPAALGHLANTKLRNGGMWIETSSSPSPKSTQLWSKNAGQACDASLHSVQFSGHATRKTLPMKPLNLPALESSSFWQQPAQAAPQRDWLKGPHVEKMSPRIAAVQRSRTNALFENDSAESNAIHWLHQTSAASTVIKQSAKIEKHDPALTSLFSNPHAEPWNRKRREDASSNKIESTEMWRPTYGFPEEPKNWLVNKRASRVEFRY